MTRSEKHQQRNHGWKNAFFILLALNIIIVLFFVSFIFWPTQETELPTHPNYAPDESSEFIVRTSKENLNNLINAYLLRYTENSRYQYEVRLEDEVELVGEFPVFSTTVPLSIHFEPFVEENGDIILRQRSIALGLLELPNQLVMSYIDRFLLMPEWVNVHPEKEEIYIAVTQMDLKSNFHVAVDTIDLAANNIAIRLNVPFESLELETMTFVD